MALGIGRIQPRGTCLLTLLHISDLHFGHPAAEAGALPPVDWKRHFSIYDGFMGHHTDALIHLTAFAKTLRRTDPAHKPLLVVTGDLTAGGRAQEFQQAKAFLESSYDLNAVRVGMNESGFLSRCIPGNHDHWPGTGKVVGPPTPDLTNLFTDLPMPLFEVALPGDKVFQLFGINSDANVSDTGFNRRWARGQFVSQLTQLEGVPPATGREIRGLLVHHSPSYSSVLKPLALAVGPASRRALASWIARKGISVMLTGHIHKAAGVITRVSDGGTTWDVLEARCGTTTQLDRIPVAWAAAGMLRPLRLPFNSLIVHRLVAYGAEIRWEAEHFERKNEGFASVGSLPGLQSSSISVCPRQ